jgi:hypothetical protein
VQARTDRVISWVLKRLEPLVEKGTFQENDPGEKNRTWRGNRNVGAGVVPSGGTDRMEAALRRTSAFWNPPREWV